METVGAQDLSKLSHRLCSICSNQVSTSLQMVPHPSKQSQREYGTPSPYWASSKLGPGEGEAPQGCSDARFSTRWVGLLYGQHLSHFESETFILDNFIFNQFPFPALSSLLSFLCTPGMIFS